MQKLKSHLIRTQSLNVLPLKPGVSQYIAMHAMLTARDIFLANFYLSGPFTCIFSKTSWVFPVLAVANTGSCIGLQNKIGHPAGCRFPCWVLAEYKYAQNHVFVFQVLRSEIVDRIWAVVWEERERKKKKTCGTVTCGMNNLEIDLSLCSALM